MWALLFEGSGLPAKAFFSVFRLRADGGRIVSDCGRI
jgi:hypothetical protein